MIKCRLCGLKDIFVKYKVSDFRVGFCRHCGFLQVLEKPEKQEIYNDGYFKRGKYLKDKAIDLENKRRLAWLKKNGLKKGAKLLEVGCATGDFIKAAKKEFDLWGFDISEYAVEQARLNNPEISKQIKVGTTEELDFPENFFDCIVLWDVVEHLWDPLGAISQLVKSLKPEGILAVSTPNINTITARLMGKRWHFMTLPEHLCFFEKKTIDYLFEKTGLTPLDWMSKGKWVNLGFLLYKIKKSFPGLFPASLVDWVQRKPNIRTIALYLPVGDIQYAAGTFSKK